MFYLFYAFVDSIRYLWLHLVVSAVIAVLFSAGSAIKNLGVLHEKRQEIASWFAAKYLSTLSFGLLGVLTAYFLSRGVDKNSGVNVTTTMLGAAIVPAISAGIALLENTPNNATKPRSGIAAFLMTTLLCYQMFYFQTTAIYPPMKFPSPPQAAK